MSLGIYKTNPNYFNPALASWILTTMFCSDEQNLQAIYQNCLDYLSVFPSEGWSSFTSDDLKAAKRQALDQVKQLRKAGKCSVKSFNAIYQLEHNKPRAFNIIMTLARFPEWYLYPESYLNEVNKHMDQHLSEINAITFVDKQGNRICPYNPNTFYSDTDLYKTIKEQESNIKQFLDSANVKPVCTAQNIIDLMDKLAADFNDPLFSPSYLEEGFYNSIHFIRKHKAEMQEEMRQYVSGRAVKDMFTTSESRSVLSEYESVVNIFKHLGWHKETIPNVLSLLVHGNYPTLDMKCQPGQVLVDSLNLEYFTVAAGLGPALKLRYVFNISAEIQSLMGIPADLIQRADKICDSEMEAYNHQLDGLMNNKDRIVDAYCVDATGYSDYLFRGIYYWIMKYLYQFDQDIIDMIMAIFRFPIRIYDHQTNKYILHPVLFGALQGCKLLVFIMNHANRLMGIIANRLSEAIDYRGNAGDDVISLNFSKKFTQQDIDTEITVFAFFNCPCNPMKTAWLERDGYVDFCSKYFAQFYDEDYVQTVSITGIPPKTLGKEFYSIKSFTELFRIIDLTEGSRNTIDYVWNKCYPVLIPFLKEGCLLPNALKVHYTLDQKIELAQGYSYKIGGLSEDEDISYERTANQACNILERYLAEYRFKPEGIFRIAQLWPELEGTELYSLLGQTERQSIVEIAEAINTLQAARRGDIVDSKDFTHALNCVNIMERNIITGLGLKSKSGSTYHRLDPVRDIDNFMTDEQISTPLIDIIESPEDQVEFALFVAQMENPNYTDIDNLRLAINTRTALRRLKSKKRFFYAAYFGNPNYYVYDEDNLIIKLTSQNREDPLDYGYTKGDKYKHPSKIIDPDVQILYDSIAGSQSRAHQILVAFENGVQSTLNDVLCNIGLAAAGKIQQKAIIAAQRKMINRQMERLETQIANRIMERL